MQKVSLLIHKSDCMGCHACEVACKQEHGLEVGPQFIKVLEKSPRFMPIYCHHCVKAPCKEACPTEAIYTNSRGIVLIDNDLCIGCKECLDACVFGAMQFDDDKGVAVKCNLCCDRLESNQEPACSSVCSTRCILWGDIKRISENILERRAPA